MEPFALTRKELYDLVWSTPMTTLAGQYGISDNGLRKICQRLQITDPLTRGGALDEIAVWKKSCSTIFIRQLYW